jgi:DNA-directed RNA polymerase beta subunit
MPADTFAISAPKAPVTPPAPVVPTPLPSAPVQTPAPLTMRKFGDHLTVRRSVFDNALKSAHALLPVENSRYRLAFSDIGYNRTPEYGLNDQREALLDGRSLSHHLVGTATLTDKATNLPVDTRRMTMAAVPYLSDQGYFIVDGNPVVVASQLRLTPGVYARKSQGGRTESHIAFLPGGGVPHRIHIDPDSGVFKMTVGQAEIPALAALRAMGATDEEIKKAWGGDSKADDLLTRNAKSTKPHHLDRLYEKFGPAGVPPEDPEEKAKILRDRFAGFKFDPWVTKRTLGRPHEAYTKDAALTVTAKLLAVSRGTAEPDDRDHPAYSVVMGPEHLVAERISRSKPLMSKLLWSATNSGRLGGIAPGFLTPSVKALFLKSGLGQNPEGASAAEFMDHGARITKIGEGGIGRSSDSVPLSARYVSSGQLPFIDFIRTSESESVGVDLRTAFGTRLGSDNRIYAPVSTRSGRVVYRSPRDLAESVVGFPEGKNSNEPLVPAIKYGKHAHVPKDQVDYFVPSMEQTFSPLTNLVPMKSGSKPHRASMGARMITQSLALHNAEAPLVQTGIPDQPGKSFDSLFGKYMGASFARPDAPGTVTEVTPDNIKIRYADGQEQSHQLFNRFPSGRTSAYQSYPLVKPGDQIAPGQILAKSNYTDDKGTAAYGRNARIGFAPFNGKVYEDSGIISESFAKHGLTSHHMYRHQVDPTQDGISIGKTIHGAAFPGKYPIATMKTMDGDGIVKVGTVVNSGDPLVLAVKKREGEFGRLSRSAKSGYSDASETWEHDEPGKVVDVRQTKNGPVVMVETNIPAKVGDKLSGRHGNKGVVDIVPDYHMPIGEDGKPLDMMMSSLGTISRVNQSAIFEAALGKIAARTGNPYVVHDFQDNQNLGKFVEDELAKHGVKFMETLTDPRTGRKIPNVGVGNMYVMKLSHTAAKKAKGRGLGGYDESGQPTRGSEDGAMRSSLGDTTALMSYGATNVLRDDHIVKGQSNDDFWTGYMAGFPVKHAHTSSAFERFLTELRAAGVDPVRTNDRYQLMGLKRSKVAEMAGDREVKNGETLDFSKENRPYPGGLHDPSIFGAVDSKCFHRSVLVWTEHGTIPVGDIVDKRLKVRVWSYDWEAKVFVLRPITGWYKNAVDGLGCATFQSNKRMPTRLGRTHTSTLWATGGHKVYDDGGARRLLRDSDYLSDRGFDPRPGSSFVRDAPRRRMGRS